MEPPGGGQGMKLNKAHVEEVEHDLAPPMDAAITIPVKVEGLRGVVVYVALVPRGAYDPGSTFREEETLLEVAKRITLKGPKA